MATILIVDDEPDILEVLSGRLARHGHTVIRAPDGRKALEIYNEQPDRINLVITGVHMPFMNGIELGKQLEIHYPHLKVIYMSAYPPARKMLKEGSVFLEKPFNEKTLISSVNAALQGTSGE